MYSDLQNSFLFLFLLNQQMNPVVAAILPCCSLERTCMLWAALRASVCSMNMEIIAYRNLVSELWAMGTYYERENIFGDDYCCFLLNIHCVIIDSRSCLWLSKAGVAWWQWSASVCQNSHYFRQWKISKSKPQTIPKLKFYIFSLTLGVCVPGKVPGKCVLSAFWTAGVEMRGEELGELQLKAPEMRRMWGNRQNRQKNPEVLSVQIASDEDRK